LTELHFEKLQADFDSRVVKQSQTKHANKIGTTLRNALASAKGLLLGDGNSSVTAPNFAFAAQA